MADDSRGDLHDPRVLRAIAHPVRNRILGELSAQGSMRAADIARELDIPANQASFHLRQLAKYGLVEEDPAAARDRRDRVWRAAVEEGLTVDLRRIEAAPGGQAASAVFRGQSAAFAHLVVDAAYGERDRGRADGHAAVIEQAVRLGKDEAKALVAERSETVERHAARTRGGGGSPPQVAEDGADRRTYVVLAMVQPYPESRGS